MLDLIKFELYKIISKPIIKITSIILILYLILLPTTTFISNKIHYGGNSNLKKIALKYENPNYTEKDLSIDLERIEDKESTDLTKEEYFLNNILRINYPSQSNIYYSISNERYHYDEIVSKNKSLESAGDTNTYKYKNLKKAENMLSKLDTPSYKYMGSWNSICSSLLMGVTTLIMLILGLSAIFSEDFEKNCAPVLLSTKLSRSKFPKAKIIAGLIYSLIVYIGTVFLLLLNGIINGFEGSTLALNHLYKYSPYDMTVIEMYLISLLLLLLGVIIFSLVIMMLSLITKNSMITLALSVLIYSIPKLLILINSSNEILRFVRYINITNLLESPNLFKFYDTINFFGEPILVPIMLVPIAIIIGIGCTLIINWSSKKQHV